MCRLTKHTITLIIAVFLTVILTGTGSAEIKYTITDLGTLGGEECKAMDVNNAGQVVGYSTDGSFEYRAFLWENDTMTDLGDLGGNESQARAINDSGQVTGTSYDTNAEWHAFLWENESMTDLGTLAGGTISEAHGINNAGQVVGYSHTGGRWHAFIYDNDTITALPEAPGWSTDASDINNLGQITGTGYDISFFNYTLLWENDTQTILSSGDEYWVPHAINDSGQIVGESGDYLAALWESDTLTIINPFGSWESVANDVNNSGQIVGTAMVDYMTYTAFIYENGVADDINDLYDTQNGDVQMSAAVAINDAGQIVCHGWAPPTWDEHSFLLTPLDNNPVIRGFSGGICHLTWSTPGNYILQYAATPSFDPLLDSIAVSDSMTEIYYDVGDTATKGFFRFMIP